jgi:hypothetical protein
MTLRTLFETSTLTLDQGQPFGGMTGINPIGPLSGLLRRCSNPQIDWQARPKRFLGTVG